VPAPETFREAGRLLVLAHRGVHDVHPTNTLAAFAAAVAAGADGIETDVRLSRDGEAVLFHDRVAPGGRPVAELSAAELEHAAGYPVPTLRHALAAVDPALWNIEIKVPEAVPAALAILAQFPHPHRLLITSFWHPLVASFGALGVETGLLLASRPRDLGALLALLPADRATNTVVWDYEMLDQALLGSARDAGVRHLTYGMTTPAEHGRCRELFAAGLRGAITDRVDLLLR
jgi:glycerophosphoryl diester phosphodiesterase